MKNIGTKLAAVTFVLLAASPAFAGKGGSAGAIRDAINSNSVDAITAELERAESLICTDCISMVAGLLDDDRYEVREVAAWWIARRPMIKDALSAQFMVELVAGDTIQVRNAADFLGRTRTYTALPTLRDAIKRDVGAEGKVAIVRAVGFMGHKDGNVILTSALADGNATVRAEAAKWWRDIRGQQTAAPVAGLLADSDATVRAEAATVMGAMNHTAAVGQLEALVVNDPDPVVRRNAAWALGKLGSASSRTALTTASADSSGLVRAVAKNSLSLLK